MDRESYRQFLLNSLPNSKPASGTREVVSDCPFCGKEGHLYISVPTDNKPSMYNCFKCNESGLVVDDFLARFNIFNTDVSLFLKKTYKHIDRSIGYNKKLRSFYITNPVAGATDINLSKLRYINNRLGINLSLEDLAANKIVLNLKELLAYNRIGKYSRDERIVDALNDHFLGFLSMDNGYVNMRKLTKYELHPSINKRYVNYNIASLDNHRKYYLIPTMIDPLKQITVHIAEGPFDILSVKYNLCGGNMDNQIYLAGCGKSYLSVIKVLLEDYGFINMDFHIYMDNDNDMKNIKKLIQVMKPFEYRYHIHNNTYPGEKDYGVPLSRINDSIRILW